MRLGFFICLIFTSLITYSQTNDLIERLKDTPSDSLVQIERLRGMLLKSVELEFNDSISYSQYNNIGMIFYSKNFPKYTEEFFRLAKEVAEAKGDSDKAAQMTMNIGVVKEMSGDYLGALQNYQESLEAFIKIGNLKSQSLVFNNIAIVHQELGNKKQSYYNLWKSYELKLKVNDSTLIASALNNLGVFYEEDLNDLDSALYFYFSAKEIYVSLGDSRNTAICQNNIAVVLYKKQDYTNARQAFESSIERFKNLDDKLWLSKALMYLGQLEAETGNYPKSVKLLEESVNLMKDSGFDPNLIDIYKSLADAYLGIGKFEQSALTYKKYIILNDSILNIDKQSDINKLEVRFQTAQKEFEIQKLQQEREIQRRRLAQVSSMVIAIVIVLGFIIILLFMKGRQRKLFLQNKNMIIKQQILQNQMNPHFLFNVLTSIQSYMNEKDSEKASSYLSKFSRLTRMVLQSSANDKILLSEEIELLTNYIQLEQLRLGNSFEYNLIVDENLEAEEINIPPMMVQPFVENAIKHGLKGIENGVLELKIVDKGEYIIFSVRDNGKGFDKENARNKNHKSMALGIINERVAILKQKFRKNVSVNYEIVEKGTKIVVELPVI